MNHILLIEDDVQIQESVHEFLLKENYKVTCYSQLSKLANVALNGFDLILLDWMLPDGKGIDFLKTVRKNNQEIPIIMLTAKSAITDKVVGLELGANDYLTKPFDTYELLARIRVQLRNKTASSQSKNVGPFSIDESFHQITYNQVPQELTKMEFKLLKLFLDNPNKVFSRDELLNRVWGYEKYPNTRTVDNHILQLRQKFSDQHFETLRGIGYRFQLNDKKSTLPLQQ